MAKFKKFTNKLSACRICNKLTHSSIDGCLGIQLCRPCYDDGGEVLTAYENPTKSK